MPEFKFRPVIIPVIFICLLALTLAVILKTVWLTILMSLAALVTIVLIALKAIKANRDISIISSLTRPPEVRENVQGHKILSEMDFSGFEKKSAAMRASEVISRRFHLTRFAIFFRVDDKYIPRIYSGINKGDLSSPSVQMLGAELRNGIQDGVISREESDCALAFKRNRGSAGDSTVAFVYGWGRSRSVFMVADDPRGEISEAIGDPEFNRVFWPALENNLKLAQKQQERKTEIRELGRQLDLAKKDLNELNRELKNKMLDLKTFVNISNDLFSLFGEEELIARLKSTLQEKMGASGAEILVPSGIGRFIPQSAKEADGSVPELSLDIDSELAELISISSKPILLPLAGSGLKHDEPFLRAAFGANFQIAAALRAGGKMTCVLLVSQKNDKSQYTGQELDFLNIICNIASLALDNIQQYSTIEKLSYTDSMTGINNYRYFYKRLSEEILRAKRYDRELALVILDIDNFKLFNDNYGHQAGDLVLKQLSELITRTIRSIDVVSRYGGEEFCIIMPDTGVGDCRVFIERLRSKIENYRFESDLFLHNGKISISVGGAVYPHHAPAPDRLIYCADMALLKAKALGRNRAVMYKPDESYDSDQSEGGLNESRQESIR